MWSEAIFATEDLAHFAAELLPMQFKLGADGELRISDPRELELVPGAGLRLTVSCHLHWPVLGIEMPLSIRGATVMVEPEIAEGPKSKALVFKLRLDELDLSMLPAFLDRGIVGLINRELEAKHTELSWNFSDTLSHVFDLPEGLRPASAIDLVASAGRVKVTADAVALAVLFEAHVIPRQPAPPPGPTTADAAPAEPAPTIAPTGPSLREAAVRYGVALAIGAGLATMVARIRKPARFSW